MRSLFTKIFLWFLLTVMLTSTASFYLSSVLFRDPEQQMDRMRFELQTARAAWETEGRAGLEQFLSRYRENGRGEGVLADANGHDVLTGKDWTSEIRAFPNNRDFAIYPFARIRAPRAEFVMPTLSRDKKYYFLAVFPLRDNARSGWSIAVMPQTWWMLGGFAILCYILARMLTSPVRRMEATIERFGQGDFTARVNSQRRDELGDLARSVDKMAERIEDLLKSQRRLLQDISHELRSPLARLGVAVEIARSGGDSATALNRIERESERLNALVGELLQVTRAEGDPNGMHVEALPVDELIQEILDDVRIEADAKHVELHAHLVPAELSGNPELLRRAVENVVRNAIRYSPEHSPVEVILERTGMRVVIAVRDYGPGVPDDALPSIFTPFYRVEKDRGRNSGGVGLGLAIALRAIHLHHGEMRARNVNPGLRVEIELPAAEVHAPLPALTSV